MSPSPQRLGQLAGPVLSGRWPITEQFSDHAPSTVALSQVQIHRLDGPSCTTRTGQQHAHHVSRLTAGCAQGRTGAIPASGAAGLAYQRVSGA